MICAELEDRLFDEDCRVALLGRAAVPADVAEHLALCTACERQWVEAVADTQRLRGRLVVSPSPALFRGLYRTFRPRPSAWSRLLDLEALSWTTAGGALGAGLAGAALAPPGMYDWAGFSLGATIGLVLAALRTARRTWFAPVGPIRRAAVRSVGCLVRTMS